MLGVQQRLTLICGAAAFAAFVVLGGQAPAVAGGDQLAPSPPFGVVHGTITFQASLLPHGFTSRACRDFRVTAYSGHKRLVAQGKSGRMSAALRGDEVECGYSVDGLYAGPFTIEPQGEPSGYVPIAEAADPHFAPSRTSVKLDTKNVVFHAGSTVNFTFVTVNNGGHAAPPP
ncbi:MAG: hypothetical protein ACLPSH_10350 [Vulcanimicrobiaceae bacterium]